MFDNKKLFSIIKNKKYSVFGEHILIVFFSLVLWLS